MLKIEKPKENNIELNNKNENINNINDNGNIMDENKKPPEQINSLRNTKLVKKVCADRYNSSKNKESDNNRKHTIPLNDFFVRK